MQVFCLKQYSGSAKQTTDTVSTRVTLAQREREREGRGERREMQVFCLKQYSGSAKQTTDTVSTRVALARRQTHMQSQPVCVRGKLMKMNTG